MPLFQSLNWSRNANLTTFNSLMAIAYLPTTCPPTWYFYCLSSKVTSIAHSLTLSTPHPRKHKQTSTAAVLILFKLKWRGNKECLWTKIDDQLKNSALSIISWTKGVCKQISPFSADEVKEKWKWVRGQWSESCSVRKKRENSPFSIHSSRKGADFGAQQSTFSRWTVGPRGPTGHFLRADSWALDSWAPWDQLSIFWGPSCPGPKMPRTKQQIYAIFTWKVFFWKILFLSFPFLNV